jgi:hypothetical protein
LRQHQESSRVQPGGRSRLTAENLLGKFLALWDMRAPMMHYSLAVGQIGSVKGSSDEK